MEELRNFYYVGHQTVQEKLCHYTIGLVCTSKISTIIKSDTCKLSPHFSHLTGVDQQPCEGNHVSHMTSMRESECVFLYSFFKT